jgi:type I restriction-modification system DNA methylase subunit
MNVAQIENNLIRLVKDINDETFIYDLLAAYYIPLSTIARLQKGSLNLSKAPGELSWKKKVFFKEELKEDLHISISRIEDKVKNGQRFVIVTDYKTLLAIDTLTKDQLDIPITDLPKYYDFFLPWAGMEKATHAAENPADVKAAEKMAKLFDEIKKDNRDTSPEFIHSLNIFFSRLLFCYFAEDTNIFEDNQFSHAVESHTRADGSDLDAYLNRLFWVLNTPVDQRGNIPNYLNAFPYVNGGLFREEIPCPKFTSKSRQLLIDSGDSNDWSAINPDIFGSMFQAVISPEHRGGLGAHYTSVPNIMKVIEPLFLNELKEAFEEAIGNEKKLKELLHRISKIKLFDPACGSGNFLIIAYKELRRLEMRILKELGGFAFSGIHLNNFYGIELDDFAHEIAKLSLWLAEHQMNVEFLNEFGKTNPTLPLQEAGQIVCGNACRLDWEKVCPKNEGDEIYIMGNPPYLGSRRQSEGQKEDLKIIFDNDYKSIDYISAWFYKGSLFIKGINSKCAFVSTNSICQGEQVSLLWKYILNNIEIGFAHRDFKWTNNAKSNAAVIVIIVGLQNTTNGLKYIYENGLRTAVNSINSYLVDGPNIFIYGRQKNLSNFPAMNFGNMPADGGKLILDENEKKELLSKSSESLKYIKRLISAHEFLNGKERYCIWLEDEILDNLRVVPYINKRIEELYDIRLKSSRPQLAQNPHLFAQITQPKNKDFILIPRHSSENRPYIPIGYFSSENKAHDSCLIIPTNELFIFSVLTSSIHMCWVRYVAGKIKTDIRYSKDIVYNNFPFPPISAQRKEELTQCTFRILEEREKHPEKTLAELYDPDKMPEGLKEAHRINDEAVERCYRSTPFNSDEERLEYLFKLYEKMIQEEKKKGTLFEAEKKTSRRNKNKQ